ncbi:MAG: nitrate- and nitrite sensing domain-containing protein [Colwellia sp.]|nr:nitrate- and nitrite sensing domain-containing protein [Colwellia sp.]
MKIKKLSSYLPFIKIDNGLSSHQFHHKIKLSLLFIFPLLISISGALFQIDKLTTRASQLANLERLTSLTIKVSHLLHILQKERGYAGVYIATNGTKFKAELLEQRELARISKSQINNLLISKNITANSKFKDRLSNFNEYLAKFKQVRLQVDRLAIDEAKAIQLYSQLNHKLIDVVATIVQLTVDSELTQAFSAYILFLKAKEKVAIERGMLSVVFARGYFLANEYNELVKLELEQEIFFHEGETRHSQN